MFLQVFVESINLFGWREFDNWYGGGVGYGQMEWTDGMDYGNLVPCLIVIMSRKDRKYYPKIWRKENILTFYSNFY